MNGAKSDRAFEKAVESKDHSPPYGFQTTTIYTILQHFYSSELSIIIIVSEATYEKAGRRETHSQMKNKTKRRTSRRGSQPN
jgi:hypothetical protein